jgi:predicted PurR-regulated permease PerM
MTNRIESRISSWSSIILQSFGIISVVAAIIYFPINTQFSKVNAKIAIMEKQHNLYVESQKEKMHKLANVEIMNIKLEQISTDINKIFSELEKREKKDEEFRKELRETLKNII